MPTTSANGTAVLALALVALSCRSAPVSYQPRRHDSGLTIQELVVPEGLVARDGDRVRVHYHGTLPGGDVFDSTLERGQPIEFVLGAGEAPPGLEEGVRGMHQFGRRKLIAPIELMFPGGAPPEFADVEQVYLSVELLEVVRAE